MKEIKIITTIEEKLWDSFIRNPMQSYAWGQSKIELGTQLIRFGVYEKETLINVFHMTIHGVSSIPYKVGYIARSFMPDDFICEYIRRYSKQNKIIFVKWEPNVLIQDAIQPFPIFFKKTTKENFARWTQVVDLTQTLVAIFDNFSKTVRRDIRFGEKNNLTVLSDTTQQIYTDFENLFFKTTARQKFSGHSKKYHQTVFKHMSEAHHSKIFVVYDDAKVPVAASEVFFMKDSAYYVYAGSLGKDTPVGGMYLLLWSIIQYAKNNGYTKLDLWGSLPPLHNPTHPWSGFTKFKKAFGGEFKEYVGSYDLIANPGMYYLYNILFLLRKALTFIKKKVS